LVWTASNSKKKKKKKEKKEPSQKIQVVMVDQFSGRVPTKSFSASSRKRSSERALHCLGSQPVSELARRFLKAAKENLQNKQRKKLYIEISPVIALHSGGVVPDNWLNWRDLNKV